MTKEEISVFANKRTFSNENTVLKLTNGKTINGFFDNNSDMELQNKNIWNFTKTPKNLDNEIQLNGVDIESIGIVKIL